MFKDSAQSIDTIFNALMYSAHKIQTIILLAAVLLRILYIIYFVESDKIYTNLSPIIPRYIVYTLFITKSN